MAKFDKSKCNKCKYRFRLSKGGGTTICNYAGVTGHTCLTREGKETIDRRGDDFSDCKLFERGARLKSAGTMFKY